MSIIVRQHTTPMIYLKHYAGALYLDNGRAVLLVHSAAELGAALQRLATTSNEEQRPMTERPFERGPARRPAAPGQASDPAARNLPAISKETAEQEAPRDRAFPAPYAEKVYTVHAVSPDGFACDLAFNDVTIEQFEKLLAQLSKRGWKA